jgi:ABC-type transport system substrate-binding protein
MDPKIASPNLWLIEGRVLGVEAMAAKAKKENKFDYDARVPGIEVLDRYTLRIRLEKTDFNFLYILAMANLGAQAREVVEHYGADIGAHPVGWPSGNARPRSCSRRTPTSASSTTTPSCRRRATCWAASCTPR